MEIKFKQLLFTVQKRTIRCNLEIAKFWVVQYLLWTSNFRGILKQYCSLSSGMGALFVPLSYCSYGQSCEMFNEVLVDSKFWIEDYKRFPSYMLAIRSIIVVFVNLFRWKTSKKFLLTLERKKNLDFRQFFYLKMLISRNSIAHDLTHV